MKKMKDTVQAKISKYLGNVSDEDRNISNIGNEKKWDFEGNAIGGFQLNRIYHADCIKAMNHIPERSIDLVVTSPPYHCGIKYDIYDDNRNWSEYLGWCKVWLEQIYRILKDD